jgi:hypothetical protein
LGSALRKSLRKQLDQSHDGRCPSDHDAGEPFDHCSLGIGDFLLDMRKPRLEAQLELTQIGFGGQIFGGPIAQSTGQAMSLVARLLEIFG